MRADLKARWIAALRSGEYKQGQGWLETRGGGYCCLGVLCVVAEIPLTSDGKEFDFGERTSNESIYGPLRDAVNGSSTHEVVCDLSEMNDDGASFAFIADWIETHIPAEE